MKKTYLLFGIIVLLTIFILSYAQSTLSHAQTNLQIDIINTSGDASILKPLTITHNITEQRQILWKATHEMLNVNQTNTSIDVKTVALKKNTPHIKTILAHALAPFNYTFHTTLDKTEPIDDKFNAYSEIFQIVAEQTKAGQTKTMRINLKDYYPYYRFDAFYEFASFNTNDKKLEKALNQYINIPIKRDVLLDFTVQKSDLGNVEKIGYECTSPNQMNWLYFTSVATKKGYYFYPKGNTQVMRDIANQNYIYYLPIENYPTRNSLADQKEVDNHQISKAIPLEETIIDIYAMDISADSQYLYLLVNDNGTTTLKVIEIATKKITQSFNIDGQYNKYKHSPNQLLFVSDLFVLIKIDPEHVIFFEIDQHNHILQKITQPIKINKDYPVVQIIKHAPLTSIVQMGKNELGYYETVITVIDQKYNYAMVHYRYNIQPQSEYVKGQPTYKLDFYIEVLH